jgi:electron transfer flavoprotein alpha subunit
MVSSLYSIEEENKAIWVFLEHNNNELESVSLELISKSRWLADQMGWEVVGLLIGHNVKRLADQAIIYGADKVWYIDHSLLSHFTIEAYSHVTFQAIMDAKPSVFLLGATLNGRDLAGRLAVRLRTGLNADCTDFRMYLDSLILICEVSGFGGGVLAYIEMKDHRPQMATVRPGVFPLEEAETDRKGEVIEFSVDIDKNIIFTRSVERVVGEGIDLTKSPVLVVGGRGVSGNFGSLEKLANILGGDVGTTRPPVEAGHIERERMIGQTGVVCRPKVAVVCGVSGAFHFIVGIQDADVVIAVNTDPEAPLFEHSDYCIVGDVDQIIPALIDALQYVG